MSTELPIPDFDHLPEEALAHRIRSLSEEEDVRRVLEHEREHANRLAVTLVLERWISALRAGEATQSAGSPARTQRGQPRPPAARPPSEHGAPDQAPNRGSRGRARRHRPGQG